MNEDRDSMGRIDAVIPDDLEKKLRMKAVDKFGGKKGSLTEALEEAIDEWVQKHPKVKRDEQ